MELATLDAVGQVQKALGLKFVESVFYYAALDAGFGRHAEDKARQLMQMWQRGGFFCLPMFCKQFCLSRLEAYNAAHNPDQQSKG